MTLSKQFAVTVVALATFGLGAAPRAATEPPGVTLPVGHYVGSLTVGHISPCEQSVAGVNSATHVWKTDAFMTVRPTGATLLLEYEKSNTKAADYFETSAGTLVLTPGDMMGGKRHQSFYYFDLPVRKDAKGTGYSATGDWIIQDACESQAPRYDAVLRLRPSHAH